MKRWGTGVAIALFMMGLCLFCSPLHAQVQLLGSDPASEEQLITPPFQIVLEYSLGIEEAEIVVLDAEGQRVNQADLTIRADEPNFVEIPLKEITDGIYNINWQVQSLAGDSSNGFFYFVVSNQELSRQALLDRYAEPPFEDRVSPYESAISGLLLISLMGLVGIPIALAAVVYPALRHSGIPERPWWNQRLRFLLIGAATLLSLSALLLHFRQAGNLDLSFWSLVNDTNLGKARFAQFLVGLGLIPVMSVSKDRSFWTLSAFISGIAAQVLGSWAGHTGGLFGDGLSVFSDFAHLYTGAFWAGGLIVLAFLLPPLFDSKDRESEAAIKVLKRFSTFTVVGLTIALATGFLLVALHTPDLKQFHSTIYGLSTLTKIGLLLPAVAFLIIQPWLLRNPTSQRLRLLSNLIRIELATVLGVLFLSGLLTAAFTANSVVIEKDTQGPFSLTDLIRDREIEVSITPFQPGINVFDISFTQNGQPLQEIENAQLLLQLPEENLTLPQRSLEVTSPGVVSTLGALPLVGNWQIRITATVDGRFTSKRFTNVPLLPVGAESDLANEIDVSEIGDDWFKFFIRAIAVGILGIGAFALFLQWFLYRRTRRKHSA